MCKISIIVPIYNVEDYLPRCLHSLLSQTFTDVEFILVNDGSTDKSLSICNHFKDIDRRIKIINQENKGLSEARNIGVTNSSGDYIFFVDSDDYIDNDCIEILYSETKNNNADVIMCNIVDVYNKTIVNKNPLKNETIDGISVLEKSLNYYGWVYTMAQGKLFKKVIFESTRFIPNKIHEDEFFSNNVYTKKTTIVTTNKTSYFYCHRKNSIMSTATNYQTFDAFDAYFIRFKKLKKQKSLSTYLAYNRCHLFLSETAKYDTIKKYGKLFIIKKIKLLFFATPFNKDYFVNVKALLVLCIKVLIN